MSDCNNNCSCNTDIISGKIKWEYLRVAADVVGTINEKNEYTLVKTKDVRPGDVVYIIQDDETFRKQLVIQLEVPPNKSYNNCMMNKKKDEKTLGQVMEEMAIDWKEFADCMPTSYEIYDDGRDENAN